MSRLTHNQPVDEEVVYAVICDGCGKRADVKPRRYADPPAGWASFSSHHSDWGNDSVESSEKYDVCSWTCYVTAVRRVFDAYEGESMRYPTLMVDGHDWAFLKDMLARVAVHTR